MARGKISRSFGRPRRSGLWSLDRLLALWAAGLAGAFAAGLYLLSPDRRAPEPHALTEGDAPRGASETR